MIFLLLDNQQVVNNMQCYFVDEDGQRCDKHQDECWCSPEHEKIWKEKNYGPNRPGQKPRPTIEQMKKRLLEMAKQAHIDATTDKNGQRRIG